MFPALALALLGANTCLEPVVETLSDFPIAITGWDAATDSRVWIWGTPRGEDPTAPASCGLWLLDHRAGKAKRQKLIETAGCSIRAVAASREADEVWLVGQRGAYHRIGPADWTTVPLPGPPGSLDTGCGSDASLDCAVLAFAPGQAVVVRDLRQFGEKSGSVVTLIHTEGPGATVVFPLVRVELIGAGEGGFFATTDDALLEYRAGEWRAWKRNGFSQMNFTERAQGASLHWGAAKGAFPSKYVGTTPAGELVGWYNQHSDAGGTAWPGLGRFHPERGSFRVWNPPDSATANRAFNSDGMAVAPTSVWLWESFEGQDPCKVWQFALSGGAQPEPFAKMPWRVKLDRYRGHAVLATSSEQWGLYTGSFTPGSSVLHLERGKATVYLQRETASAYDAELQASSGLGGATELSRQLAKVGFPFWGALLFAGLNLLGGAWLRRAARAPRRGEARSGFLMSLGVTVIGRFVGATVGLVEALAALHWLVYATEFGALAAMLLWGGACMASAALAGEWVLTGRSPDLGSLS